MNSNFRHPGTKRGSYLNYGRVQINKFDKYE